MATGVIPNPTNRVGYNLGTAGTSGKTFTLPGTADYLLLFTGHSGNSDLATLWSVRVSQEVAFQLCGGSRVTVTVSSDRTITVTTITSGTVNVAAIPVF